MKRTIFLLFIFTGIVNLMSQEFAPIGAEWHYSEGFAFDGSENYLHIKSVKDTIINGIYCRKLIKNHGLGCSFRPDIEFVYSESNKVYFWDDDVNRFQKLYDFNAEKDSSWQIILPTYDDKFDTLTIKVDSVSYRTINNKELKNLYVTYLISDEEFTFNYKSEIIETIGDISYLFNLYPNASLACDANYSKGLRCYEDADFGFYNTGIAESCDYVYNWRFDEFAPSGAQWYFSEHAGGSCPGNCEYLHLKSTIDTVILEKRGHKIERTYYQFGGNIKELSAYYVVHEKDTVFLYDPINKEFDKLYVFNVKVGDTIELDIPYEQSAITEQETFRIVIESVEDEELEPYALKKYYYKAIDGFGWISNYYFDHIGGNDWFIPRGVIIPEAGGPLRCYKDWIFDIKFSDVACDHWITGIEDIKYTGVINIFPNPASDFIQIETESLIRQVKIYDINGKLKFITDESVINITEFENGMYFIIAVFENGEPKKGQFIKH